MGDVLINLVENSDKIGTTPIFLETFHGNVGWMPRLVGGEESRQYQRDCPCPEAPPCRRGASLYRKRISHERIVSGHTSTNPIFCSLALLCCRRWDHCRAVVLDLSSWCIAGCSDNYHTYMRRTKGWYVGYSESKKHWVVSVGIACVSRSAIEYHRADTAICCSSERKVKKPNQAPKPTSIDAMPRAGHEARKQ